MTVSLKYTVIERERRFSVRSSPDVIADVTGDEAWTGGNLATRTSRRRHASLQR
jgi:hypothetical protein